MLFINLKVIYRWKYIKIAFLLMVNGNKNRLRRLPSHHSVFCLFVWAHSCCVPRKPGTFSMQMREMEGEKSGRGEMREFYSKQKRMSKVRRGCSQQVGYSHKRPHGEMTNDIRLVECSLL